MGSEEVEKSKKDFTPQYLLPLTLIAFALLALSIYLAVEHYVDQAGSLCDVSSYISCTAVRRSSWSELFGVPVAIWGLCYGVSLVGPDPKLVGPFVVFIFLWTIAGGVFVFYLVFAEVYIGAICPACTVVHVLSLGALYLAKRMVDSYPVKFDLQGAIGAMWDIRFFVMVVAIVHIIPIGIIMVIPQGPPKVHVPLEFAQCVTERGWVFFGKRRCPWCKKQRELFGTDSIRLIKYIDCAKEKEFCREIGMKGYPTWVQFDEHEDEIDRHSGYAPLERLVEMTGCNVEGLQVENGSYNT